MDPPSLFIDGEKVEVTIQETGFEGCWFTARIIRKSANEINKFWVEYQNLLDAKGWKPLKEYVELKNIRPLQPQEPPRLFKEKEEVDAFHNDGWWKGIIAEVLQNSCYKVEFKYSNEKIDFKQSDLRPHLEWIDGNWVNLALQNQEATVVELDERNSSFFSPTASPSCSTSMKRKRGRPKGSGKKKRANTSGSQNLRIISPLKVTESEADMDVTNGGINQGQVLCLSSLEKPLIVENNEDVHVALDKSMDERDTPLDSVMDLQQLSIVPQNSPSPVIHEPQQMQLFEKTSVMWNSLEGSEIFKSQNPHFLPLENVREKFREERALTNNASIEEERDVFEDQLGLLNELEEKMVEIKDMLDKVGNRPDSSKLEMEKALNEIMNLRREIETLFEKLEG